MLNTALTINPEGTPQQLIKIIQLAEDLNFSTCYLGDQGFTTDIYVALTAVACNTRRIRLGPGVTHPFTRHPVVTAVSVASLDQLSGGRAFLGIGAGGSRSLVPMQIPRTKPLQLTRETVEIARLLWKGVPVTYSGEFFNLKDARIAFECRPDIEVHWAARGPKMLELGGELADWNLLHGIPRFDLPQVVETVRKGAKKANRPLKLQYSAMIVYDETSRRLARARTAYRMLDSTDEVRSRLGITEERMAEIRRLVTTSGPSSAAHLISDDVLRNYAIEGTPGECADELRRMIADYQLSGITFEVNHFDHAEAILRFAAQILEKL